MIIKCNKSYFADIEPLEESETSFGDSPVKYELYFVEKRECLEYLKDNEAGL